MSKAQFKPQTADVRTGPMVGSLARPAPAPVETAPTDAAAQRQNVRDFLRAMSAELSVMAHNNGLEALALIFETARETADAETAAEKRR